MIPARQIFESFAGCTPASPPPDPIDAAQVRLAAWESGQPFHVVSALPVTLGIGEECGELADATTADATLDAVGDIAVYVCQVATRHRLAMRGILMASRNCWRNGDRWRWLVSAVGKVNHLVLKRAQGIREGTLPVEEYRSLLCDALADLIAAVEVASVRDPEAAFLDVAAKILERDWRADPVRGGEAHNYSNGGAK